MPDIVLEYLRNAAQITGYILEAMKDYIIPATVAIIALRLTWWQTKISAALATNKEQMHLLDLFAKTTELIGSKNKLAQMGGLYLLSSLTNTRDGFQHIAGLMFEAYIKEHAPDISKIMTKTELAEYEQTIPDFQNYMLHARAKHLNINVQAALEAHQSSSKKIKPLQLQHATLKGANIIKYNLSKASFQYCDLGLIKGQFVNFSGAFFSQTSFKAADLENANFNNAGLWFTNFYGARLVNASFDGANFYKISFQNADLSKASGLTQEMLNQAYGNKNTKLPPGLTIPFGAPK